MTATTAPIVRVGARPLASPTPSITRLVMSDFAPFAVALVPFSLAIGTASAMNGLTLLQATFGAVVLLAGTSQLAAIELIGSEASSFVIVGTVILINARFIIYGAGLAGWFRDAPRRQRLALAYPLVDQSFLCCEERFGTVTDLARRRRYYLGGTALLMTVFLGSQIVGFLAGPSVPPELGLHLAAPLAFAGMLAKSIRTRAHAVSAAAAALTMLLCTGLPGGLGLPIAIAAGLTLGSRINGARQ